MVDDPVKERALLLLWAVYQEGKEGREPVPLDCAAYDAGLSPQTRLYSLVVNYLVHDRAMEEAKDVPQESVAAAFYRITPHGLKMLREAGYLAVNRGFERCLEEAAERRELEGAGWEPVVGREGKSVWRSPGSGYLYPQGVAIAIVREGAQTEVPLEPEGGV
jgi:hypothetical protein